MDQMQHRWYNKGGIFMNNNVDIVGCFAQNLTISTLSMQLIGAVHAIERAYIMVDYHIG
jgi:hypothetical protein